MMNVAEGEMEPRTHRPSLACRTGPLVTERSSSVTLRIQFRSVQVGIYALGPVHVRFTPSPSLPPRSHLAP